MLRIFKLMILLAFAQCSHTYEVGSMLTEFAVEHGQAKYVVPVTTPKGFPTHLLEVQLQYTNGGGNGPLGVGWSIAGLTQIIRCQSTPAQDGLHRGVHYDYYDRFCYEGSRLVVTSGSYGRDGSTYGTEVDSFMRAYSYGYQGKGPQRFLIKTKENQKMTFGSNANSRVFAHRVQSIHAWKLDSISDYFNNVIKIKYVDNTNGLLVSKISYNNMVISFEYEARSDVSTQYLNGGVFFTQDKRLRSVKTLVSGHLHREIKITYQTAKTLRQSIISTVQLCSRGGKCYKPETMTYQGTVDAKRTNSPRYWIHEFGYNQGWRVGTHSRQVVDMNDDGLADIVGFSNGGVVVALNNGGSFKRHRTWVHSFGSSSSRWRGQNSRYVVDVNGDHLPDIVGISNDGVYVSLNTGKEYFTFARKWLYRFEYNYGWRLKKHATLVKDVNGDGLVDIVGYGNGGRVYVALGTGYRFKRMRRWSTDFRYFAGARRISNHPSFLEDVTGDGLPDVVRIANGGIYVGVNTGTSFKTVSRWGSQFGYNARGWRTKQYPRFLVDVNGDGLVDVVEFSSYGVEVSLCTGRSFLPSRTWFRGFSYNNGWRVEHHPRFVQDVNGDGLADVVGIKNSGVYVALNSGSSSFSYKKKWTANFGKNSQWENKNHPRLLADVTGDGVLDIVCFAHSGVYISTNDNKQTLLTSITDSYKNTHKITYSSLADKTIYTRGNTMPYPNPKVNVAQTVVKQYTRNNGIGGLNTTSFTYSGMRVNLKGRGVLGFSVITEKRHENGEAEITFYHQNFPFTRMTKSYTKKVGGLAVLQSTKSYGSRSRSSSQKQVLLQKDVVNHYELNGNLVRTEQLVIKDVDDYGNIKMMKKITTGNGNTFEQKTINNYTNNPQIWYIGQLDSVAVSYHGARSTTIVRRSAFYYDRITRSLKYELREPNYHLGIKMSYVYDSKGNVVEKAKTPILPRSASLTPIPRRVFKTYDREGLRLLSTRNDFGHTESYKYDIFGNKLSFVGVNGLKTTYKYDAFDRRIQEIRPDGVNTKIELYFSAHHSSLKRAVYIEKTTRSGDQDTLKIYDCFDRPIRIQSKGFKGQDVYQDIDYGPFGQVRRQSLPYYPKGQSPSWVLFKYDKIGREVLEERPLDGPVTARRVTLYNGLESVTIDANGKRKKMERDVLGRIIKVTDALGGKVTYQYDSVGNLIKTTDPGGHVTSMAYDRLGNKISMNDPNMGLWEYSYDAHGQKIWQKDAVGNEMFYTYDRLGRMIDQRAPEGRTKWIYDQSAHGKGKLFKTESPNGHVKEYTYDKKGRETNIRQRIDGQTFDIHSSYNNLGQLTQQTLPQNKKVNYCYDGQGFLTEVSRVACGQGSSKSFYWKALAYDSFGHIAKEQYGNALLTDYIYDGTNHIKSIKTLDFSSKMKRHWEYKFDSSGNMLERRDFSNKWNTKETFFYDALDRITKADIRSMNPNQKSAFSEGWEYDSSGNLRRYSGFGGRQHEYSSSQPHAVIRAGPNTYSYDANGNMVKKNNQHVTWTSFNKPRTIERKTRDTVKFEYDASQNRFKKSSPEETSIYIGKLYEKITDSKMNSHKYFIYALGRLVAIDTKVESELSSSAFVRYVHGDHLNSVDTVTDEKGNIIESLRYSAYGQRRSEHWANFKGYTIHAQRGITTTGTKRGFTGHEHLEELDLIHMNGRIYDPVVGRFLSPDPHVQDPYNTQNLNRYSYTLNNPLKHTDPSGYFFKRVFRFFKKFVKPIIVTVAAVVVSAVTLGAVAPLASAAVASIGLSGASATVAAGAIAGSAAGFVGGTIAGGSFRAGLKGALGGAITGGIGAGVGAHFGSTWNLERVAAQAIGGGVASTFSGGEFEDGFFLAGATASANYLYNTAVHYEPTWYSGGPAQPKTPNQMPIEGANNIGIQGNTIDPTGWLNEGGRVSRFLNEIPGVNAVAGLHDSFQVGMDSLSGARDMLNVPGMFPAAGITYGALIDGPASQALLVDEERVHRDWYTF